MVELQERVASVISLHQSGQPSPYSDRKGALPRASTLAHSSAIERAWRPVPIEFFDVAPAPRPWLLHRPADDFANTSFGPGLCPLGKAGVLSADGGTGKTQIAIALAICVITGRPWLGHFPIGAAAAGKNVLLALAEEDEEEAHRRIYSLGRALRLTADERALVQKRLVVLALAGRPCALVSVGADRRVTATPEHAALLRMLASRDAWALVVLDPLARFAEGEIEASNDAATRAVQAFERCCDAPGRPTVLAMHHVSSDSAKNGTPKTRGVSGLRDAFRWEAILRPGVGDDAGFAFIRQTKSNYSRPMAEEVRLARDEHGVLRAVEADDEQRIEADRRASEEQRAKVSLDEDVARIVAALAREGRASSIDQIVRLAGMNKTAGREAVRTALSRASILKTGTSREPLFVVAAQSRVCAVPPIPPWASGAEGAPPGPPGMDASGVEEASMGVVGVHAPEAAHG